MQKKKYVDPKRLSVWGWVSTVPRTLDRVSMLQEHDKIGNDTHANAHNTTKQNESIAAKTAASHGHQDKRMQNLMGIPLRDYSLPFVNGKQSCFVCQLETLPSNHTLIPIFLGGGEIAQLVAFIPLELIKYALNISYHTIALTVKCTLTPLKTRIV